MRAFACFLLATFAAAAAAAPFAVQVGGARIALDAPPGFADTGFTGSPRLQELAESLTSASNRILIFAISDGDLRRFTVGDTPEFRRYMLAVTPKAMEGEHVNARTFSAFVGEALGKLGKAPAAGTDLVQHLDARLPGEASVLAELRREADVVSVLQGTRLPAPGRAQEAPRYVLYTTSLILLRGKALTLSVYTYDGFADLDWLRAITGRWIHELQRLNHR